MSIKKNTMNLFEIYEYIEKLENRLKKLERKIKASSRNSHGNYIKGYE
jgi:hypothetical protein